MDLLLLRLMIDIMSLNLSLYAIDVITALKTYKDLQIAESQRWIEFRERLKEWTNPNGKLILTFNKSELLERVKIISGRSVRVKQYIPHSRRCCKCQHFGHVGKNCRSVTATCIQCAIPIGNNSASSINRGRYLLEKEIQYIGTTTKIFSEAIEVPMNAFIRPVVSCASVLRRPPIKQSQPSNQVRWTRDGTKVTPEPPA